MGEKKNHLVTSSIVKFVVIIQAFIYKRTVTYFFLFGWKIVILSLYIDLKVNRITYRLHLNRSSVTRAQTTGR